jgi:hypothetical protein
MKKCKNCGGLNSNSEYFCDYCSAELPRDKIFTIKEFLDENYHLFTILGIFGGLSFYLTNLALTSKEHDLSTLFGNVGGSEIVQNASELQKAIVSNSFYGLTPDFVLTIGIITSYFIFIGVLIVILLELLIYPSIFERNLTLFPLLLMFFVIMLYVITIFKFVLPFFAMIGTIYLVSTGYVALHNKILSYCANKKSQSFEGYYIFFSLVALIFSFILAIIVGYITLSIAGAGSYSQNPLTVLELIQNILIWIFIGLFFCLGFLDLGLYELLMFNQLIQKFNFKPLYVFITGIVCLLLGYFVENTQYKALVGLSGFLIIIGIFAIISIIGHSIYQRYPIKL